ncbi:MAG: 3'-5' exonuclease [Sphaerobacter sp.]|nr:3'-5' exonuclease [Sphaerobacter sp.]
MQIDTMDRVGAVRWAAEMLRRDDVLFLDTETTGLDEQAEIVEIAAVDARGTVLLDTLVRPRRPIPVEARAVHGISDAMVAAAPTWPAVQAELARLLRTHPRVVIYNAAFDRRMLAQTARGYRLPPLEAEWHCAMLRYAAFAEERHPRSGDYRWHRLEHAAAALGVAPPTHRALGDVRTCWAVVAAMAALPPR